MTFTGFLKDGLSASLRGGPLYWTWLLFLFLLMGVGLWNYSHQLHQGLVVTGLSDQVSWGFYIANFAFFVGIAAAAVLLVIPAYLFHRNDVKAVVLIGEGLAVAAVIVAMVFVLVDLGRIDRTLHMIPLISRFNWPQSMLAWDVVVLNGYLLLNLAIPMYILYQHYQGKEPVLSRYFIFVVIAIFWAISIHTVTAFVFSANVAPVLAHLAAGSALHRFRIHGRTRADDYRAAADPDIHRLPDTPKRHQHARPDHGDRDANQHLFRRRRAVHRFLPSDRTRRVHPLPVPGLEWLRCTAVVDMDRDGVQHRGTAAAHDP
jgi:hypothetical protein